MMSDNPKETGIFSCTVMTGSGPKPHSCLWNGEHWFWLDSSLEWDLVSDFNCYVTAWQRPLDPGRLVSGGLSDVLMERRRQDGKWGGPDHDDEHVETDWIAFIKQRLDFGRSDKRKTYRQRMVEIGALAIAALESHDRKAKP